MDENYWKTISADEYKVVFERFGGSFAVHPDVVALVSSLAKRSVRYAGLTRGGLLIAAVPLWGGHIVATRLALRKYGALHLIDVGDSEVIIPVVDDQSTVIPFEAGMISSLNFGNIVNLERDHLDASASMMMVAKPISEHSGDTKRRRRRETRRFLELGGRFQSIREFTTNEVVDIYKMLYKKRFGDTAIAYGFGECSTVFRELQYMMRGDILLFNDRPVAMELVYAHETPRWLIANGVQRVSDPEFWGNSVGSVLAFRNLEQLENEARHRNKKLRYCYGWNSEPYKAQWAFEQPAYRLTRLYSLDGDETRDKDRDTPLERTEWHFTAHDFAKIETLEAREQRLRDALALLERTTQGLAEASAKSLKTTEYLRERVDDINKKFDHFVLSTQYLVRRSVLEQIFFRPDGRPVEPLRLLLFHTSGEPRHIFRRLVLHKDGTPRGLFSHWLQNRASVSSDLDRKFPGNL